MRVLTDDEAHVLLLRGVELIPSESDIAEELVLRGYMTTGTEEDGDNVITYYNPTHTGQMALDCYLMMKKF